MLFTKMADFRATKKERRKKEDPERFWENTAKKCKTDILKPDGGAEKGSAIISKPLVEMKQPSLVESLRSMQDRQTRISGLKEFCQLCRTKQSNSPVLGYLRTSPNCRELFSLLEAKDRPTTEEMKLIWNAFEAIFLTLSSDTSLKGVGDLIMNKIFTEHVKLLYSAMNPSCSAELTAAVLKLLTSILAQGQEGVRKVLKNFDFTFKGIENVARRRSKTKKDDVRTCFLKLCLAFFVFGDSMAIKETLELQVLMKYVMNGLAKDQLEMIHLVVSTLTEKVVKKAGISKKSKLLLFTENNLIQLANLYVSLKQTGNKEIFDLRKEVRNELMKMLIIVCTDKDHGILFGNSLGYLSVRSNNPVLLCFLTAIQKLASNELEIGNLISRTLSAGQDLIIPFVSRLELNLEPNNSKQWLSNASFVIQIWNQLPPVSGIAEEGSELDYIRMSSSIFPKTCDKSMLTNGIKHHSYLVKAKTLDLILACLRRADSLLQFLKKQKDDGHIEGNEIERFLDIILLQLPDIPVFITAKDKFHELAKDGHQNSSHGENQSADMKDADFCELEKSILRIMKYLQHFRPGIFTSADYNICKLFNDNFDSMSEDTDLIGVLLSMILLEPLENLIWLSKRSQIYTDVIKNLLMCYVTSTSRETQDGCEQLIKKLLFETRSVKENADEVGVWLKVMLQCATDIDHSTVIEFFQEVLLVTAQDLYSLIEEVIEIAPKDSKDYSQDEWTAHSHSWGLIKWYGPVAVSKDCGFLNTDADGFSITAYSEKDEAKTIEFSPIVVAALRSFEMAELRIDGKYNLDCISRFICFVLMDVLMSQVNVVLLCELVLKYVSRIKKNYSESKYNWIGYWDRLQAFSTNWCYDRYKGSQGAEKETIDIGCGKSWAMTVASILRCELFPLRKHDKLIKHNESEDAFNEGSLCTKINEVMNWTSIDSMKRDTKVILCVLSKHAQSAIIVASLANILKKMVAENDESKIKQSVGYKIDVSPCALNILNYRSSNADICQLVLESPVIQTLYLSTVQPHASDAVTEILSYALKQKVVISPTYYLAKLPDKVLTSLIERKTDNTFLIDIMRNLELFCSFVGREEQSILLSNTLDAVINFCLDYSDQLTEPGVIDAIVSLIKCFSKLYNSSLKNDFNFHHFLKLESHENHRFGSALQTGVLTDKVTSILKLYENKRLLVLEHLLVLLFRIDHSFVFLATAGVIDACIQSRSTASVDILKLLVQNSPYHAFTLSNKFTKFRKSVPTSVLIQVTHTLLSTCYNENRSKLEDTIRDQLWHKFISIITDAEDYSALADDEFKMASDLLKAINRESDALLATLTKSLHVVSSTSKLQPQSRFLIKLFEDCCNERFVKEDVCQGFSTLIDCLMLWKKSILVQDKKDVLMTTLQTCIQRLCSILLKVKTSTLELKTVKELVKIWRTLLPSFLKNGINDSNSLETIKHLLALLYDITEFRQLSDLSLENVYDHLMSHSQFFPLIFDGTSDLAAKESILDLLLAIVKFSPSVFEEPHLRVLMAAYNASLSSVDQKLVHLLKMYENHGVSVVLLRPLVWGKRLLAYPIESDDFNLTTHRTSPMPQILECLDRKMLIKSALNFPLQMDVTIVNQDDLQLSNLRSECYDPRFLFPIFSYILSSGFIPDCRSFIERGCLAFTIAALSSQIPSTRKAAYHILLRFMNHIESAKFPEKNQVVVLLDALKNTIIAEATLIPSTVSCFMMCCLQMIFRPDQHMYGILNNRLLRKPFLDIHDANVIVELLNNHSLQEESRKLWVLNMVKNGLRSSADYYIYKRSRVFEQLMCLYDLSLCDDTIKASICDVILAATKIHPAAFDLVKSHGLLSWVSRHLSLNIVKYTNFVAKVLHQLLDTFQAGCEFLDGHGKKDVKKPVPKNFACEALAIAFSLFEKYNQKLNMTFLDMVSQILYSLIESEEIGLPLSIIQRKANKFFETLYSYVVNTTEIDPFATKRVLQTSANIMNLILKSDLQNQRCIFQKEEFLVWLVKIITHLCSRRAVFVNLLEILSDLACVVISWFLEKFAFTDRKSFIEPLMVDFTIAVLTLLNVTDGERLLLEYEKVSRDFTALRSALKTFLGTLVEGSLQEELGHLAMNERERLLRFKEIYISYELKNLCEDTS